MILTNGSFDYQLIK